MGQTITAERTQTNVPIGVQVSRDGGIPSLTVEIFILNGDDQTEFLDFSDGTFKAGGHVTPTLTLTEEATGWYTIVGGFDLSAITIPAGVNTLMVYYDITAGGETGNDTDTIQLSDLPDVLGLSGTYQVFQVLTRQPDAPNKPLTGRLRVYNSAANALLDDGATGLKKTYNTVSTYDGDDELIKHTMT